MVNRDEGRNIQYNKFYNVHIINDSHSTSYRVSSRCVIESNNINSKYNSNRITWDGDIDG